MRRRLAQYALGAAWPAARGDQKSVAFPDPTRLESDVRQGLSSSSGGAKGIQPLQHLLLLPGRQVLPHDRMPDNGQRILLKVEAGQQLGGAGLHQPRRVLAGDLDGAVTNPSRIRDRWSVNSASRAGAAASASPSPPQLG